MAASRGLLRARDFWIRVTGMLQQNWALIEREADGTATIFFVNDMAEAFDLIPMRSPEQAARALRRNGFEPAGAQTREIVGWPGNVKVRAARDRNHSGRVARIAQPVRPVYSSGEVWVSDPEEDMVEAEGLDRFVRAQEGSYGAALAELEAGRKRSHWMWFVLPQLAGLGRSEMSQRYAIRDLEEARAYLAHPVLGPRLRDCVRTLLRHRGRPVHEILGSPDDAKFRSCLTLFLEAGQEPLFREALEAFYDGRPDPRTLRGLGRD